MTLIGGEGSERQRLFRLLGGDQMILGNLAHLLNLLFAGHLGVERGILRHDLTAGYERDRGRIVGNIAALITTSVRHWRLRLLLRVIDI
mgnify:CR=1 FL=1